MADNQDSVTQISLSEGDRLKPDDQVLVSRVGSDLVLLDVVSGRYFGLDEIGTTIFELIREGRSLGEVHAKLAEIYDCDPQTLWVDLDEFSRQMLASGLFHRLT